MKGGKQPGAGRPASVNPTKPISVRLTAEQHAAYIERGGARWLKRMLSITEKPNPSHFSGK